MPAAENMMSALEMALVTARTEYRDAVTEVASLEAAKKDSADREPADVDRIHHARTRVIALEAAREELSRMIDEGASLSA